MVTNSLKSPKFVQINLKMFNNYVANGNNNQQIPNIAADASIQEKNNNTDMNNYSQRKKANSS